MAEDYTPRQVSDRLTRPDVQLIDVREVDEWEAGRIAGALHIPLGELSERSAEVDRERTVIFYCRSGSRSAMAAEAFAAAGFEAHNMTGGLLEWSADGLSLDPAGARVA